MNRVSEKSEMDTTLQALVIDCISVAERLELIEQIWDSLPDEIGHLEIPAWHIRELARRRADVETNPGVGKP